MYSKVETISPDMAKKWLNNTPEQFRKLNTERAKRIAEHITSGRWEENGETIKISREGRILDGQHRLYACTVANQPIRSLVVYEVTDTVFVDTGKARSASELLQHNGYANATTLAATAKWQWLYENGKITDSGERAVASPDEILRIVKKHPTLLNAIATARQCDTICNTTPVAFAYYQFSQRDPDLADLFISCLSTGLNLKNNDAVYILRQQFIKDTKSTKKMQTIHRLALIVKAWNAWRQNRTVSNLVWRRIGPTAEDFPEIL